MKYAVITGSTKGIGKAIAENLLSKGWYTILNYAHDDKESEKFIAEHREYSDCFSIIKADLSSKEEVSKFVNEVLKITNKINCLILNSGATDRTEFDKIDYLQWEKVINTNINAPFFLVHSLRDNFVPEQGRIIFIGSAMGIYPHSVSPAYGVTKAAVHQMAKELVKFFGEKGVTVNAVAPGFVETPWQKAKPEEQKERIKAKTALHRFGTPDEIARLCYEIINNQYINGSVLRIDGGYSFR